MYKILILAYLIGSDPIITQQNFEMQGWYRTMQECQANLLKQHPDQTYEVMREFVEDNDFKWDWLVAGCTNEETRQKIMLLPDYPKGKPDELEGLTFELKDLLI